MLRLWKERDDAARRVGHLKHEQGLPLQNFEVEKSVLDHAQSIGTRLHLHPDRVRALVRMLIESAIAVQERERVRRAARDGRRALIVGGAGLMGGWFARFLEERGFSVHVDDPTPSPYPLPREGERFDLILVSTPPSTVPGVLRSAAKRAGPDTLLADIASIKGASVPVLRALARDGKKVASLHPMFGPGAEVLMGRNVLVLDCGDADAVAAAKALFDHTTARIHELPVEDHDPLMAELLGLSHAMSLVFNETLARGGRPFRDLEPFSSTTFRKQVELSREFARENPSLYYEIQALNPATSGVFERLEAALGTLRKTLERGDQRSFVELMERGRAFYEGVMPRSR